MADGNLVSTNTVIQGATLTLLNQPFEIDLMPIKLGSFDVIIVFPEDLPGLPPVRQVEFQIDLIPRATPKLCEAPILALPEGNDDFVVYCDAFPSKVWVRWLCKERRPNGDALRKYILKGPYTPTIVTTPVVPATEDSPAIPE
ncbi:hypothetical protein Tco_1239737 [Tanacetum coccineum]